jgi:hypothetical protein
MHSIREVSRTANNRNMALQSQIFGGPSKQILQTLIPPYGCFWFARSLSLQRRRWLLRML